MADKDQQFLELLHYIKNRLVKEGASDAVVGGVKADSSQIKFVNNKIAKTGTEGIVSIGIFFVKDKKIVTTNFKEIAEITNDDAFDVAQLNFLREKADKVINKLLLFSKPLQQKADWFGIAEGPFKYGQMQNMYDSKIADMAAEKQVDIVEAGVNSALKEGARRCGGIFSKANTENFLVTSKGVEVKSRGTSAYFSIRAMLDKDSSGHNTASARMLSDLDVEKTARFAGQIAALAKKPKPGKKGTYAVVFAPMAWGALLDRVADATSIFSVEAGMSFLANKVGQQVGSSMVNLFDDATVPGCVGSGECDAEGVPTQKNVLIERGVLKTFLHNTSTARKYGVKTTANAGLVAPGPANVVLEPGKISKDELFKDVQRGVYITNIWYTRFQNYAAGDFSTIPRDGMFLIENGQIAQSLKNLRIKENILNLLGGVAGIASDAKQMTSWEIDTPVTTPHVLIKEVNLTKPTK
ncbi:MAG: TldD/PmbA family protein [archaeon]